MKCVVNGDLIVSMVVDGIREQLEPRTMAGTVVASRVSPGGGDEEIGMYCFVQERIYGV